MFSSSAINSRELLNPSKQQRSAKYSWWWSTHVSNHKITRAKIKQLVDVRWLCERFAKESMYGNVLATSFPCESSQKQQRSASKDSERRCFLFFGNAVAKARVIRTESDTFVAQRLEGLQMMRPAMVCHCFQPSSQCVKKGRARAFSIWSFWGLKYRFAS